MTRPNQGLSALAPGGGKMRDHGNEVVRTHACGSVLLAMVLSLVVFHVAGALLLAQILPLTQTRISRGVVEREF